MSSVLLSPHTTALNIPPDGPASRPRRATVVQKRGRERSRNSTSPVSTNASFTSSMSTHSKRRTSHSGSRHEQSPEKKSPASSTGSRRSKRNQPPQDASPVPFLPALGLHIPLDQDEGEGETEVDVLDNITVNGQSETASAANTTSDRAPSEKSVTPEKVEAPAAERRLKLFVGSGGGKKRKAEDEVPVPPPAQPVTPEVDTQVVATPDAEAASETKAEAEIREAEVIEENKRVVRKKRKWLKKGEVDPDDPVAVARQKEKHKMIDEAIANLDAQEKMLHDGTHPALLALWDELERRRQLNHQRIKARLEAAEMDLANVHKHDLQQARFNWRARKDDLADQMMYENIRKESQLNMERVQLRRNYSNKPYVREGRGGGGWEVHENHLLSNKEQPLVEVMVDGKKRLRRDLNVDLECVRGPELEDDLIKLGVMRDPNIRSPSPPPPVKPVVKRPTPYAPSPVQPRENYPATKSRATMSLGLGPSLRTYVRFDQPRQQPSPIASSSQPPPLPVASSSRPSPIQVATTSRSATPAGRVAGDVYDHARERPYERHLPPISGSAGSHVTSQMFPEANEGRYRTDGRLPPPKREPWTPAFPGMPGDYLYSLNPRY